MSFIRRITLLLITTAGQAASVCYAALTSRDVHCDPETSGVIVILCHHSWEAVKRLRVKAGSEGMSQ